MEQILLNILIFIVGIAGAVFISLAIIFIGTLILIKYQDYQEK